MHPHHPHKFLSNLGDAVDADTCLGMTHRLRALSGTSMVTPCIGTGKPVKAANKSRDSSPAKGAALSATLCVFFLDRKGLVRILHILAIAAHPQTLTHTHGVLSKLAGHHVAKHTLTQTTDASTHSGTAGSTHSPAPKRV
mmetsp:Transcript_102537/g.177128  ORF Transcript_102537/g.177128 Transcript_102537/m.177128 type:complete len:140 (-) Transcript_102537:131-550(-)